MYCKNKRLWNKFVMLHEKFRHKPNFGFAIKKNTIFEELGFKKCKHVLTLLQCSYATATHEKYYIDKRLTNFILTFLSIYIRTRTLPLYAIKRNMFKKNSNCSVIRTQSKNLD